MELKFDEHHCYRYDAAVHITPNSELYKAQDLSLKRTVALKKVKIAGDTPGEIARKCERAMQEVTTMIQICELTARIPAIYTAYCDKKQGEVFIVMQWIGEETLADKIKRGVSPAVFLRWMQELCLILDSMAVKDFQHKDIKPENIMFNRNNELYLIDFNISVSVPNRVEGTMFYKAPEMDRDSTTADRSRVDMFSIGVMLYEYITGRLPIRGIDYDYYNAPDRKWNSYIEPIKIKTDMDNELNRIIVKLMSYDPKDRYSSYKKLISDLKGAERSLRNAGGHHKRH